MSDSALLVGIAEHLDAQSVGDWDPVGAYASNDTGIAISGLPSTPDQAISLTSYVISDDPTLSDSVTGVQVRTRGGRNDPTGADDLASAVFDQLQNFVGTLNGIRVLQIQRRSGVSLGADGNNRFERSDNYAFTIWRPSTHRY